MEGPEIVLWKDKGFPFSLLFGTKVSLNSNISERANPLSLFNASIFFRETRNLYKIFESAKFEILTHTGNFVLFFAVLNFLILLPSDVDARTRAFAG